MQMKLTPALETGLMRALASFQDPEIGLSVSETGVPLLRIEEAGVTVELEFPDVDCLSRFQQRVGDLRLLERQLPEQLTLPFDDHDPDR